MEAARLTIRGDDAERFADELVEAKADERRRSLNKRGVRNIHRFGGEGFTQLTYERAARRTDSWVMVSVLVEAVDEGARTVVVFVGGGGEGPFKLEEPSMKRALAGEEGWGERGRFGSVVDDIADVCERLDLTADVDFQSESEASMAEAIERKLTDR